MKFSLKWLGDFIETGIFFKDPSQLATALTQSGLETDAFEDQKAPDFDTSGLLPRRIISLTVDFCPQNRCLGKF